MYWFSCILQGSTTLSGFAESCSTHIQKGHWWWRVCTCVQSCMHAKSQRRILGFFCSSALAPDLLRWAAERSETNQSPSRCQHLSASHNPPAGCTTDVLPTWLQDSASFSQSGLVSFLERRRWRPWHLLLRHELDVKVSRGLLRSQDGSGSTCCEAGQPRDPHRSGRPGLLLHRDGRVIKKGPLYCPPPSQALKMDSISS